MSLHLSQFRFYGGNFKFCKKGLNRDIGFTAKNKPPSKKVIWDKTNTSHQRLLESS